jgi:hypothetical protein
MLILQQPSAPATQRRVKPCSNALRKLTPWPTATRGCDAAAGLQSHPNNLQIPLRLETIITVSVVAAFTVFGLFFLRMVYASERLLAIVDLLISDSNTYQKRVTQSAIGKGRRTHWRIQLVLFIVICAYSNRAVFECMRAFAYVAVNRLPDCSLCADCQPVATVMATWFELNPAFSILSSVIAAPAALTLSLYVDMCSLIEKCYKM